MIFTVVIGLLFVAVVFFHYLQGLFSATLSAIFAVIAAVLAFSWHETIVEKMLQGKAANTAHAMVLVVLFATIYLVLRIIFDKLVPAGVTLPAMLDRVGGAILGAVAATFALGTLAIAAEELPFGPAVAGYTKYDTYDKPVQVLGSSQKQDGYNFSELHSNDAGRFNEVDRKQVFPMILPGVDEIVVNTVAHLSDTGSLQGSQSLTTVHPDFLQELYGQNIGIQTGAKHVVMNLPNATEPVVRIDAVYVEGEVQIFDGMQPSVRANEKVETHLRPRVEGKHLFGTAEGMLLVVRVTISRDAADDDAKFRFSPGSIHLVARKAGNSGNLEPYDYYPIGTVEHVHGRAVLYADKPDDYLFVQLSPGGRVGVDLAFIVDKAGIMSAIDKSKIDTGVFIEVKRLFREDLSGKEVDKEFVQPTRDLIIGAIHQKSPQEKRGLAPVDEVVPVVPVTKPSTDKP